MDHDETLLYYSSIPLKLTEMQKLTTIINENVCKIITDTGNGTGFLCSIKTIPVLITNNQILNKDEIKNGQTITIEIGGSKNILKIYSDRKTFTDLLNDTSIIEIKVGIDDLHSFLDIDDKYY